MGVFFVILSVYAAINIFEAGATSLFVARISQHGQDSIHGRFVYSWFCVLSVFGLFVILIYVLVIFGIPQTFDLFLLIPLGCFVGIFNLQLVAKLEGAGNIGGVAKIRTLSQMLGVLNLLIFLVFDFGPQALALSILISHFFNNFAFRYITVRKSEGVSFKEFTEYLRSKFGASQLRLAVSYFCGYFVSAYLTVHLAFTIGFENVSGISALLTGTAYLNSILLSWHHASVPYFAKKIEKGQTFLALKLFRKITLITTVACVVLYTIATLIFWKFGFGPLNLVQPDLKVVGLIFILAVMNFITACFSIVLRATGLEYLLGPSIFIALIYFLIYVFFPSIDVGDFFLVISTFNILVMLPWLTFIYRRTLICL